MRPVFAELGTTRPPWPMWLRPRSVLDAVFRYFPAKETW